VATGREEFFAGAAAQQGEFKEAVASRVIAERKYEYFKSGCIATLYVTPTLMFLGI
jgi:hypothetical protein